MTDKYRVYRWREKNRDSYNEYMTDYRQTGYSALEKLLGKQEEYAFERDYRKRQKIIRATPDWVSRNEIRRFYENAVNQGKVMKLPLVVDHEVPISGRNVCGLHVPWNLKVVSESYKKLRGNKFDSSKEERRHMGWLKERGL